MTIDRIEGRILIECNGASCKNSFDGTRDFSETMTAMKSSGWRIKKIGSVVWNHYCPSCLVPGDQPNMSRILRGL